MLRQAQQDPLSAITSQIANGGSQFVASPQIANGQVTGQLQQVPMQQPPQQAAPQFGQPAAPQYQSQPIPPQTAPPQQQILPDAPQMVAVEQGATLQQIQAACPGASNDFIVSMLNQGATVVESMSAYVAHQNQLLAAQQQAAPVQPQRQAPAFAPPAQQQQYQQAVQPVAAVQPQAMPGNMPVAGAAPTAPVAGQAAAAWNQAVAENRDLFMRQGLDAQQANIQAVMKAEADLPGVRLAMLNGG